MHARVKEAFGDNRNKVAMPDGGRLLVAAVFVPLAKEEPPTGEALLESPTEVGLISTSAMPVDPHVQDRSRGRLYDTTPNLSRSQLDHAHLACGDGGDG